MKVLVTEGLASSERSSSLSSSSSSTLDPEPWLFKRPRDPRPPRCPLARTTRGGGGSGGKSLPCCGRTLSDAGEAAAAVAEAAVTPTSFLSFPASAPAAAAGAAVFLVRFIANRKPSTLSFDEGRDGDGRGGEGADEAEDPKRRLFFFWGGPAVPSADQLTEADHTRPPRLSGGAFFTSRATSMDGGSMNRASGTGAGRCLNLSADACRDRERLSSDPSPPRLPIGLS